jgi:hypothetical protein
MGAWDYPDTNFNNPALAGDFFKTEANSVGDGLKLRVSQETSFEQFSALHVLLLDLL